MERFADAGINELILDCLADNTGFQGLIGKLAKQYGVVISIITIEGKILFQTGKHNPSDFRKYVLLPAYSDVYMCPLEKGSFRVASTIFSDELPYGAVLISCSEGINVDFAAAMARSLSKIYQYYFDLRELEQISPFIDQIIAHFLLSKDFTPGTKIKSLEDFYDGSAGVIGFNNRFTPGFTVAVFSACSPAQNSIPAGAVAQFSKYIPNSYCMISGSRILSFIYGIEKNSISEDKVLCSTMDSFCKYYSMNCAVSGIFNSLAARHSALNQASVLISHRDHFVGSPRILLAENHHKEMILFGALEVSDCNIFRLSDIELLSEYDKKHGTEYLATLESYLLSAGQFTKAAKMLFVDRGTLKYRMNKIRELISSDPDDPQAAERLLLAIDIRKIIPST